MPSAGTLLCLASAAAFGAMGIFGKLAYDEGATVGTLLAVRFALAAALFWLCWPARRRRRDCARCPRRDVGIALALGAVGYSAQAGGYFAALERLDASLLSLLVYTFPAIVTVAAIALGRERRIAARPSRWRSPRRARPRPGGGGRGGAGSRRDGARAGGRGRLQRVHPHLGGRRRARRAARPEHAGLHRRGDHPDARRLAGGDLDPGGVSAAGFGWLAGIAVVSTVGAVGLFFAGLQRVGPTAASILSTLEPVVTVGAGVRGVRRVARPRAARRRRARAGRGARARVRHAGRCRDRHGAASLG